GVQPALPRPPAAVRILEPRIAEVGDPWQAEPALELQADEAATMVWGPGEDQLGGPPRVLLLDRSQRAKVHGRMFVRHREQGRHVARDAAVPEMLLRGRNARDLRDLRDEPGQERI